RPKRGTSTMSTPIPAIMPPSLSRAGRAKKLRALLKREYPQFLELGGLLHGHRLGQVTWLVNVEALGGSQFASEDLQWHGGQQRHQQGWGFRYVEDPLGEVLDGAVAIFGNNQGLGATGAHFLDIGDNLGVQRVSTTWGRNYNEHWLAIVNQRNRAVL